MLCVAVLSAVAPCKHPNRLSTVDLLEQTSLDQLLLIMQTLFTFDTKTTYLNEEVKCTEPSPSVSVPNLMFLENSQNFFDAKKFASSFK